MGLRHVWGLQSSIAPFGFESPPDDGSRPARTPEEKSDLIHAIYERIVIEGPRFVGLRLTPAAYRHGLALALPEAVMARPTGVGRALATYDIPIEGGGPPPRPVALDREAPPGERPVQGGRDDDCAARVDPGTSAAGARWRGAGRRIGSAFPIRSLVSESRQSLVRPSHADHWFGWRPPSRDGREPIPISRTSVDLLTVSS